MSTDPTGDHSGSQSVAQRLSETSDQIWAYVERVRPDNVDRLKLAVKVAFSAVMTALLLYWVLAYQFGVVWVEF
ncbi:hypothetical protein GRS48_12305 [Halorubrum sp. JWXQ-INN 858]|uniref:hypothetical protein n=1 Tax=Halorubrum sp. JWXQ-INN 858 TaxID=2690782 RepID=UPI00135A4551|nr:hypothetical protein [Halorubrum sp. JWXQ-INN 858]MWV65596.1 hypothetical protein [Halorubrum sp. JWXQ-INN 858]